MHVLTLVLTSLVAAQDPERVPTFTEDVAPIVFARCASCHRPGEVAPFPLLTYADVKKRGKTIAEVVEERYMPPWHPVEGFGAFRNTLRLDASQVKTITRWVKGGMAEGPKEKLPPLPSFADGWQLGEPDLVVQMDEGFEVPASGRDVYRNFAIPLDLPEDRWLTAIEVRPSARDVLHHVLFFLDEDGTAHLEKSRDGKPGFSGMRLQRQQPIGVWAVGGMPERLPEGLAVALPKGRDLVLQSHFHPSGKKAVERTTLGLHFAKTPPKRTLLTIQLPPFFGIAAGIDIPAGDAAWRLEDEFELPCDVDAVLVGGHAHMLARTMRMQAEVAGKEPIPLLRIDDWDFDWQNSYTYRELVRLPKGATVRAEIVYDNSKQNPNNPHKPPERVRWGRESTDEMGSISLMVVPADEKDLPLLQEALKKHVGASTVKRFENQIDERFAQYDTNKDGKVTRDEVPRRMERLFGFLDGNGDGSLDKEELKKALEGLGGALPGGGGGGGGGSGGGGSGGGGRRRGGGG